MEQQQNKIDPDEKMKREEIETFYENYKKKLINTKQQEFLRNFKESIKNLSELEKNVARYERNDFNLKEKLEGYQQYIESAKKVIIFQPSY
jgi:hypothetical protein